MIIKELDLNRHNIKDVCIYGATVGGKIIKKILNDSDINVIAFCDRAYDGEMYDGIPLIRPNEINNRSVIIIGLMRSFVSAVKTLDNVGFDTVYTVANIINKHTISEFEVKEEERLNAESFFRDYALYAKGFCRGEKIVFPVLEIFITECCTLKCRDCSHLIPYYSRPKSYDVYEVIDNLKKLLTVVDEIKEIMILGGEPFLHPDLKVLVKWIYNNSKIEGIRIITNSTVFPKNEIWNIIHDCGAELRFSNYGKYSREIDGLIRECTVRNIKYLVYSEPWTAMGDFKRRNYSESEIREVFQDCPFAYAYILLKNRLYRCAHVAHLNNQKHIDTNEHDSMRIDDIAVDNIDEKRREINDLMRLEYMDGCNYCNGFSGEAPIVEPAIQIGAGDD